MSLKINHISINNSIDSVPIATIVNFKSNPQSPDKVEISNKKKELSVGAKVGIGLGISAVIGLAIELICGKGKHLKSLWEKITGKGGSKPPVKPNPDIVKSFKSIDEAKTYFENLGIKAIFKSGSENHLSDLNKIKNDLVLLEKNGVALTKPESIIISDWHNKEELKQIFTPLNINESQTEVCNKAADFWGTVARSNDNKYHVLINSSFGGDYGAFIHEMGHIHQDYLNSSFWHSKGLNGKEFMQKQMEVFGLAHIKLNPALDTSSEYISSIFRYFTAFDETSSPEIIQRCRRIFPNITASDDNKVFCINDINGKTYYIDAKKMVDKMASESGVYAPTKTWENVAEIFQGLNRGKEYSDLVMLMYDINGGGRVPNLVIKGKKYDDYIESLYNNPDLIQKLRECIEVKEFI
mgnify:CR=1 FL=1